MTANGSVLGYRDGVGLVQVPALSANLSVMCEVEENNFAVLPASLTGITMEKNEDGTVSLVKDGFFIRAAPHWDKLEFNSSNLGDWEKFRVVSSSDLDGAVASWGLSSAPHIWGDIKVIQANPSIIIAKDCIYLPWNPSESWGLFSSDGDCIEAAMTERKIYNINTQANIDFDSVNNTNQEHYYIYCGYFNCHFGHFLIDTLSRLWFAHERGSAKLLFHSDHGAETWFHFPYVREVLNAIGITINDVVVLKEPVRLPEVLIPKTSLSAQRYIHHVYGEFCRNLNATIGPELPPSGVSNRVYLSRSQLSIGTGSFVNESEMEQYLANSGVKIIHPEELTFRQQLGLMQHAEKILAIAGSALHLSIFSSAKRIVALSANNVVNANYHLIDRVAKNTATYLTPVHITKEEKVANFATAYRLGDPKAVAYHLLEAIDS
ncbi:MAG: glycosyltransferase 61 family protein [Methylorubrum populi]